MAAPEPSVWAAAWSRTSAEDLHVLARINKKSPEKTRGFLYLIRRRPTLPRRYQRSTIGAGGLNFRVRDGNGWDPSAIVARLK